MCIRDRYKALCHKLKRQVAIKVLKEEFSSDSGFVSKFKTVSYTHLAVIGKGHEDYQEVNGVRHHFSDREVVLEIAAELEKNE